LVLALHAGEARGPVTASGGYERFRRTRIVVKAPATDAGKAVSIRDAGGELGKGSLAVVGATATAIVMLPMPALGKPYGMLTCVIDGEQAVAVELANADVARQRAFNEAPLHVRAAVFGGSRFPTAEFASPNLIEDLVGSYTLTTTVYDVDFTAVTTATRPGRYGAVVVATAANGWTTRRFATLFRTPSPVHWWETAARATVSRPGLPGAAGIDPLVVGEQGTVFGEFLAQRLFGGGDDGQAAAELLACLHATTPALGALTNRNGPDESNATWWLALKKRLGLSEHRYLSFVPETYATDTEARFPLLIFLHGSGEAGTDLELVRKHGPHHYLTAHANPFVIIAPQCDPDAWWHAANVLDLLDEVRAKYRIDDQRIYLTGLSLGGFGTWTVAGAAPERFAAVAPICGEGDIAEAARMKELPIWTFHGAKDRSVPVQSTKNMVDALIRSGGRVRMTIYPDAAHDAWTQAYNTPELYAWLLRQRRGMPEQPAAGP